MLFQYHAEKSQLQETRLVDTLVQNIFWSELTSLPIGNNLKHKN